MSSSVKGINMITYNNSVMISPNGNWLKPPHIYSGVPITVPYEYYCDGHRVTGFQKYTLPDNATEQSSGLLPSSIRIKPYHEGNNIGYRIESEKFDDTLTGITFENDPRQGLYLDGCYNFNNGTVNITSENHGPVTLENDCLQNTEGTFKFTNVDYYDPIYFGANCCTNMDLLFISQLKISRIGANSFRNVTFGNNALVGNIDPNCCVNMTQPMSFGNLAEVYSDLEPFILAHKDRCDELGIKAITFGNDCKIYNAERIRTYYSNYITYNGSLNEVPRQSGYGSVTME